MDVLVGCGLGTSERDLGLCDGAREFGCDVLKWQGRGTYRGGIALLET